MLRFEEFQKEGVNHIKMVDAPFVEGKIIMLKNKADAEEYAKRPKARYAGQLEGYRIFIRHSGFTEKPDRIIPPRQIKFAIDQMCIWYKTKLGKSKLTYQIINDEQ